MQILNITDSNYPTKLLNISNPPSKIYAQGNINLLNNHSIAIVGSRNCTAYGKKYAEYFAKEISNYGISIISGLAIGIDTIAHQSSMYSRGKTIAIIGSGLNKIYPTENIYLAKEILNNDGCIISEYEPNAEVVMTNFPNRNRIIAGLSDGILIIEASKVRSGSVLTGNLGLKENKNVYCLPRNIGESKGTGTNHLIKNGAKLVTEPKDILINFDIEHIVYKEINTCSNNFFIKPEYKDLYQIITTNPIHIQDLILKSHLNITELSSKLTMMELEGYIKSLPGNEYVRL